MKSFNEAALSIVATLESEHESALKKIDELDAVLTRLKYEGKPTFGKNIKDAKKLADFFDKKLLKHIAFEEKTIFTFLVTHIPKLEPAIQYLCNEHHDFKEKLTVFTHALNHPPEKSNSPEAWRWLEKIISAGTYIIYLFRHHTEAERRSLYDAIESILRDDEKNELRALIRQHWKKEAA